MHLQGADRGHDDGRVGAQAGRPALDVEELLRPHVRAESRLRADDVVRRERDPVGEHRVVAVGDVRERPAVDECRPALEGLEQVRLDRVLEEDGHRAGDLQVLGGDRLPVARRGQDHPAEPGAQVRQVRGQREDRHDLRGDRDDELGLAGVAVLATAEPDDDLPQRAIADVEHARPEDPELVDAQGVAVVDVVVDEGGREVVGRADRVDVARSGGG